MEGLLFKGLQITYVTGWRALGDYNKLWDIYVNFAAYANGTVSVTPAPGDTFTWSGGAGVDPGGASAGVVIGTGGHVFNAGGVGLDAVNDGASFARLHSSQLSGNMLDFNLPYANKGALATISQITNSQMQNGGVFGMGGQSAGTTAYNSVTKICRSTYAGTTGSATRPAMLSE